MWQRLNNFIFTSGEEGLCHRHQLSRTRDVTVHPTISRTVPHNCSKMSIMLRLRIPIIKIGYRYLALNPRKFKILLKPLISNFFNTFLVLSNSTVHSNYYINKYTGRPKYTSLKISKIKTTWKKI